jgi:TonB family protein
MANVKLNYSPYGAFELKSKYQTNLLKALITVSTLIALLLGIFYISSNFWEEEIKTINTKLLRLITINIDPPKDIVRTPIQLGQGNKIWMISDMGIFEPVVDSLINDGSLAEGQDEQAQTNQILDLPADNLSNGLKDLDGNYIPRRRGFMSFEILPELIYYEIPEYPIFALETGTTGEVWVKVLIDKTGEVIEARVAESSSYEYFDSSAVKAAYKNIFKPAIQNGIPYKVWVKYKVEFELKIEQTELEQQP